MSHEKASLRITELDFLSIKENLKTFLRSQEEFQDFDFEGSGISVLLDILAYNTHMMGYYLNMVGNEMFLDSAQIRNSIVSHAKLMNYVPGSPEGALVKANIQVTPSNAENQDVNVITLEKYTRFLGTDIEGINHQFVTLNSNTAAKEGSSFLFSNVYLKQGEVITLQYLMEATNEARRFEIPSRNVDTTSIAISVQESSANLDTTVYTLSEDITEVTSASTVYYIEENENNNYSFYFGDDVLGRRPIDGNIIICTYLDNVGTLSNSIDQFVSVEPVAGLFTDNVRVTANGSSYGGSDRETIEQVRFRAPYFYTTQNRAVIESDYETLLLKDYNYIKSISVWGGQKNDPVVYGKVFVSIQTKGNYALTNFEKENIKNSLIGTRSILTVTPEIIDPDYVYILVKGNVHYNPKLTSLTSGELLTLVKAAIQDYVDNELSNFKSTFRKFMLQEYLEEAEKSITGSDLEIFVEKRVVLDTTRTRTYTIKFNMPLKKAVDTNRLLTFPQIELYDASGAAHDEASFEEVPEALTGIASIELTDSGVDYTSVPIVTVLGDGSGATAEAEILSGHVNRINVTNPGTNYSTAVVTIIGGDGAGATAVPRFQVRTGTLRTYYYKSNREKVIINANAGTIDYDVGIITLNSLRVYSVYGTPYYLENVIAINIQPEDEIIPPLRNRIIDIDMNNPRTFQINMIAE